MAGSGSPEVTQLLLAWSEGDQTAFDRLVPLVYAELHRLAKRYMRDERPEHTLQATALIHEAYMRLIDQTGSLGRPRALFWCCRVGSRSLRLGGQLKLLPADEAFQ